MTTEQAHSIFKDVRQYVVIEKNTITHVFFEEDEPFRTRQDNFGQSQHLFNVNGGDILGISSKPLLRALKPFTPLGGKELLITRSGKGFKTKYVIDAVEC